MTTDIGERHLVLGTAVAMASSALIIPAELWNAGGTTVAAGAAFAIAGCVTAAYGRAQMLRGETQ